MVDYRFPDRIEKITRLRKEELEWLQAERKRGMIGERQAASFAEYTVALALWFLRMDFRYKYRILHTQYTVDFYIDNGGEWVPLDVINYTGLDPTAEQRLRTRVIEEALGVKLNVIYDTEVRTFEDAIDAVRMRW